MDRSRRQFVISVAAATALAGRAEARGDPSEAVAGLTRPPAAAAGPIRAPALLLATTARPDVDPAGCLISEKFDGVRAFWDGDRLWHRSGRPVAAPAWFLRRLPSEPLDGELWLARGRFEALVGIVRRSEPIDAEWHQLRYLVFELPGGNGSFAERAERLHAIAARTRWPALHAVEQARVPDRVALQRRLAAVIGAGGEGLMLHRADAPYVAGRSDVLVKLKPSLDAEARVVGTRAGRGRLAGRVGALQVETPEGVRFHLGSGLPDALRRDPPPPGTLVSYRYHDLTATGVPRFASFLRLHPAL